MRRSANATTAWQAQAMRFHLERPKPLRLSKKRFFIACGPPIGRPAGIFLCKVELTFPKRILRLAFASGERPAGPPLPFVDPWAANAAQGVHHDKPSGGGLGRRRRPTFLSLQPQPCVHVRWDRKPCAAGPPCGFSRRASGATEARFIGKGRLTAIFSECQGVTLYSSCLTTESTAAFTLPAASFTTS